MLIQFFYSLLHSVDLHGGCSSQHISPWSCLTLLRSKGLWREITQKHWQSTPACVSAGHRWHNARLKAPGMSWWRKSDVHTAMGLSGEKSPLATDSPSKWRQFYTPQGNGLQMYPFPTCVPPSRPSDVWMKANGSGWGVMWCGREEAGNLCVSSEACLMAFPCHVFLSRDT